MAHLAAPGLTKCHTLRRFNDACYQLMNTIAYGEYLSLKYQAANAPIYINNDDCVKETFTGGAFFYNVHCPMQTCGAEERVSSGTCALYDEYIN